MREFSLDNGDTAATVLKLKGASNMLGEDILYLPIGELERHLRQKAFSHVKLTQSYLDGRQKIGPKLNAYVTITSELALDHASAAELTGPARNPGWQPACQYFSRLPAGRIAIGRRMASCRTRASVHPYAKRATSGFMSRSQS